MIVTTACVSPQTTTGGSTAGQPSSPTAGPAGGNVNIRLFGDWGNPIDGGATMSSGAGAVISNAMYDRLVTLSSDGKVIPYLASSWTETPSSVTFTIRNGATCSDGEPVTPTVVANSLKRLVSPDTKSPYPASILGPGPYTVTSDDAAGTVTFSVGTPFNELVYGFTWFYTGIVCPKGLEPGADFSKASYGSGPYVFKSAVQGSEYVVTKREGWTWGPNGTMSSDSGFPDTLTFSVITNETTAANLLLTGGLDIASVTGTEAERLAADKSVDTYKAQAFVAHLMVFNEDVGHPTADEAVREALMTAVDPQGWNEAAYKGFGLVTPSIVTPDGLCYDPATEKLVPTPAGDVNKARSILVADGFSPGADGMLQKGGTPLSIVVTAYDGQNSGPEYLAAQFNSAGIQVDLRKTEYNSWAVSQVSGTFDVLVPTFAGAAPVVGLLPAYFSGPFPPAGLNRTRTDDSVLTDALTQARSAAQDQRCPYWSQYQQRILTKHHALPLAAPQTLWFSRGFTFSANPNWLEPWSVRRKG
jgi:peptide/nickel transport system substrate-binding protein